MITATPAHGLIDEPVRVTIAGLRAGQTATLTARWPDVAGVPWVSRQTIHGRGGPVVLSGVDGMRFIWAMRPLRGHTPYFTPRHGVSAIDLTLTVSDGARARATLYRRARARGVYARTLTLRRDRLDGSYFTPARGRGRPRGIAAVVLGGSEGGTPAGAATSYADHGYPALALCYFKCPGLP